MQAIEPRKEQTLDVEILVEKVAGLLCHHKQTLSCAESCTGGLLAATCTALAGSSQWFEGGVVSYSNACKQKWLNVRAQTLEAFGAVSAQVVEEMAIGIQNACDTNHAISISGIAGPSGGSDDKPIGCVYFGFFMEKENVISIRKNFNGDRYNVQIQATKFALEYLYEYLIKNKCSGR
jgi:nicotinamide-nucleotide amidase